MKRSITIVGLVLFAAALPDQAEIRHYDFAGSLSIFNTSFTPADASAAFKSIQNGDTYHLAFDVDSNAGSGPYFDTWGNAIQNIRFTVPARGVAYFPGNQYLTLNYTINNPYDFRWDVENVDSSVTMTFWARDFSHTALTSGNIVSPMNFVGFHNGNVLDFAFYANGGLIYDTSPVASPTLRLTALVGTNSFAWENYDTYHTNILQIAPAISGPWSAVTNAVTVSGSVSNTVALPQAGVAPAFYRLLVQ